MLHILLTILKIIGIILASILGLMLLLLLVVLFVPIHYRASVVKTEGVIDAKGRVSWLFGAFGLNLFLKNKDFRYEIRIFGISLENIQKFVQKLTSKKNKAKKKVETKQECKNIALDIDSTECQNNESVKDIPEEIQTTKKQIEISECEADIKAEKKSVFKSVFQTAKSVIGKIGSVIKAIWNFPGKIIQRIKKIRLTISSVCDKIKYWTNFLKEESTQEAISMVKEQLLKVLKHILPKKIRGNITFGFDDPATTGQVLGGICAFYPLYYKQINISPDFTQNILLGDIYMKGRVYICFLVITALKVYFDKNIQHIIKTMKK